MGRKERMYNLLKAEASNSFYIEGLFIHGAHWNEKKKTIVDLEKYEKNGSMLPLIHLTITQ